MTPPRASWRYRTNTPHNAGEANVYLSRPQRHLPFSGRGKWYLLVLFILVSYLIVYAPYFQVRDVVIAGVEYIDEQSVSTAVHDYLTQRTWILFPRRNPLFLDATNLQRALTDSIQQRTAIDAVSVVVRLPDTVTVTVRERTPMVIWSAQDTTFSLDRNGVITEQLRQDASTPLPSFPFVYDLSDTPVAVGDTAADPLLIDFLFTVDQGLDIEIDHYMIPDAQGTELRIKTTEGWDIFLDRAVSFDLQRENLRTMLDDLITETQRASLSYIDLRYEDRAYFK